MTKTNYVIERDDANKLLKQIRNSTISLLSIDVLTDDKGDRLKFCYQVNSPIVIKNEDGTEKTHVDISTLSQTVPLKMPVKSYDQALQVANEALSQQLVRWSQILTSPGGF